MSKENKDENITVDVNFNEYEEFHNSTPDKLKEKEEAKYKSYYIKPSVINLIDDLLDKEKEKWKENGRKGNKPTLGDIIEKGAILLKKKTYLKK